MKATGVVRRIDELGRIVIPKEIRKTLRIKEGENLEIFIDDKENVVLKKYSLMNKIEDFAQNLTDTLNSFLKHNIIITDNDSIIAASGKYKKKYLNKSISSSLENMLFRREKVLENYNKKISLINEEEIEVTYAVSTIISNGDITGLVIIFDDEALIDETDFQICQIVSNFLGKHLEDWVVVCYNTANTGLDGKKNKIVLKRV